MIQTIIVGVGINFDVDVKEINCELKNTQECYEAASLVRRNGNIRPVQLVQAFLVELEKICDDLNSRQVKKIVSNWTKRSSTIGRRVTVDVLGETVSGVAKGIAKDGALMIEKDGKMRRIIAGSITDMEQVKMGSDG